MTRTRVSFGCIFILAVRTDGMDPIDPALTQVSTISVAGVIAVIALVLAIYGLYYQRAVIEPRFGRFEPLGNVSGTFRTAANRSGTDDSNIAAVWSNHHQLTIDLQGRNAGTGPLQIHAVTLFVPVLERPKELLSEPIIVAPKAVIAEQFTQEIARSRSIPTPINGTIEIRTSGGDVTVPVRIATAT